MDEILTLETDSPTTEELQAAIDRCLAKIDELQERMRLKDAAIEASRQETLANLAEIAEVLAELKAA